MKIKSFDLIRDSNGSLKLKKKTIELEGNENIKRDIESIYLNPFKTQNKNNYTSAKKNELKKSYVCLNDTQMSSFFEKLSKNKQNIRNKFNKKMKQSSFIKRSLSLRQSREFEEKIELEKLSEQAEKFSQSKNDLLIKIDQLCKTQIQHINNTFNTIIKQVKNLIDEYKNNYIDKCITYTKEFKQNLCFLDQQIRNFKKIDSDYENSIYQGLSEKFRIYYQKDSQKKIFKEEKTIQHFYLNQVDMLQQKKLIDSMSQILFKSIQHFPKFAEVDSAQDSIKDDIDQIKKYISKKLKSFQIYLSQQKQPDFSSFSGKFIFSPIISQNFQQIYYNNIKLQKIELKIMDSIEKLNCISVNQENKIFMGLQNGQILRFNPTVKNFEKELFFSDQKICAITPVQSCQQYFDNKVNFFQMNKKKDNKLKKNYIISYQCNKQDNDIYLWDLNRNSIVKRYQCVQQSKIKGVIFLNDEISFFTYTQNELSFYYLNQIQPVFKIQIDNIIKAFCLDNKHIIVQTQNYLKTFKCQKQFKENTGKKCPINLKFLKEIQLQKTPLDIVCSQQDLVMLNSDDISIYNSTNLELIKQISLEQKFCKLLVLTDIDQKQTNFLLIGQQKIIILNQEKILQELEIDTNEIDIQNIKNLMFINFKENFKVLFISQNKNKKYIYEISFNQFCSFNNEVIFSWIFLVVI